MMESRSARWITLGTVAAGLFSAIWWLRRREHQNKAKKPRDTIIISSPAVYERKRRALVSAGPDQLQIISDFDRTISVCFKPNGERGKTSHGVIENSRYLPAEYRAKAKALWTKYYPIEINDTIPLPDKTVFMEEWWNSAHQLLVEYKMNKRIIEDSVKDADILLRDGFRQFIDICESYRIPVLIFSAGLGECLKEILKQHHSLRHNMFVVANTMRFDSDGSIVAFDPHPIHSLNKNYTKVLETTYAALTRDRRYVILLGDNASDVSMAEGGDFDEVLRVGFLNDEIDKRLEEYKTKYDVVILHDGSFGFPTEILSEIVEESAAS